MLGVSLQFFEEKLIALNEHVESLSNRVQGLDFAQKFFYLKMTSPVQSLVGIETKCGCECRFHSFLLGPPIEQQLNKL